MTQTLADKRVVITRAAAQADGFAEALKTAGAIPIAFPTIAIAPLEDNPLLDEALTSLINYDWLIFTSVNGVQAVVERLLRLELPIEALKTCQLAAIGPATAAALTLHGLHVSLQPKEYVAEAIMTELARLGSVAGQRFLLLRADIARASLREQLSAAGAVVTEIPVYQTVPGKPTSDAFSALREGVDIITFTSSSTVRFFFDLLGAEAALIAQNAQVVCIGPITAHTAQEFGLNVAAVAEEYTISGLLQTLQEHAI